MLEWGARMFKSLVHTSAHSLAPLAPLHSSIAHLHGLLAHCNRTQVKKPLAHTSSNMCLKHVYSFLSISCCTWLNHPFQRKQTSTRTSATQIQAVPNICNANFQSPTMYGSRAYGRVNASPKEGVEHRGEDAAIGAVDEVDLS